MTFLNPFLAFAGLACVGIPILIHILMRRRRRPIQWAAMRFLLEAYQQQRKRLRFEQWLLLASRCLLVALIAIAIGRPVLGGALGGAPGGPTTLYLVIDHGLASGAQDVPGAPSALARSRERALKLLAQLDANAGDRVALISGAAPARALVLPATSDLSGVRELIESLRTTDGASDLSGAIALARADAASEASAPSQRALAVLSDFRVGSIDLAVDAGTPAAGASESGAFTLLADPPGEAAMTNVSIAGVEPLRPLIVSPRRGEASTLAQTPVRVALRRSGDLSQAQTTMVRLSISPPAGGAAVPVGQASFRWAPGQSQGLAAGAIDLSRGGTPWGSAVLAAQIDADAIAGDNTFRHTIELRQALRVGIIAPRGTPRAGLDQLDAGDWFRLALQTADAEIEITDIEPAAVDAARLSPLDAVILPRPEALSDDAWRRVRALAEAGGLVLVCPPAGVTVHAWGDAMARALGTGWSVPREVRTGSATIASARQVDSSSDLLALLDAELPDLARPVRVSRSLPPEGVAPAQTLLSLSDGAALIAMARPGQSETSAPKEGGAAKELSAPAAGLIVYLGVAPSFEWTDLQARPLMVPLVHELVRQGVGRASGRWAEIAGRVPRVPARTSVLRPTEEDQGVIRVDANGTSEAIARAGAYRALDDRGLLRGVVTINADAGAGRVDAQPRAAVERWLASRAGSGGAVSWLGPGGALARPTPSADLRATLGRGQDNARLILIALVGALALGVVELAMARWFSHASVHTTRSGASSVAGPSPRSGSGA